ncbi:MAG: ribose 5-phosphate isomerase B [Spirochaetaceae bacterium]|nr:ribose 5-phosphate isomerase B [Spirochaetaceae bacterium]
MDKTRKIALASDHGGFFLKTEIKSYLQSLNFEVLDFGCESDETCDYARYGYAAAKAVAGGECGAGIVICGTGAGISLAANKVKGIRCTLCGDCATASLTKRHNNANMIALGGRITGVELAKKIVFSWLEAEFEGGRHLRRVNQIAEIENGEWE